MPAPGLPIVSVDHIGIAAIDQDHAVTRLLGVTNLQPITMPSGVHVGRFGPERRLELVWPERGGSPIERFLWNRGGGLHHIGLTVRGPLDSLIRPLRECGFDPAGMIEPSADGRPSIFLHPHSCGGVLIELVEQPGR